MTTKKSRYKALSLLRRRDRAKALKEMDDVLKESEKIASDLDTIQSAINRLNECIEKPTADGPVSAAMLRIQMDDRRVKKRALQTARSREEALKETAKEASLKIDAAKDAVAKAQKALAALEKPDDE
jgi:chromosome segregation ATPase